MLIRKLRLQKGWSQEQLAELTGLNVRTIQRLERGQKPGMESARALAAVFELDLSTFINGDASMNNNVELKTDERIAIEYVKGIKEFYSHLIMFVIFAVAFISFKGLGEPMIFWGVIGWGIGVIIHGLVAYEKITFIGAAWEKKQIEKKLGRDL